MNEQKEINTEIMKVLTRIKTSSPELTKYLDEMRFPVSDIYNPVIEGEHLQNYYKSLLDLLISYQKRKACA